MSADVVHWARPRLSVLARQTWCGMEVTNKMKAMAVSRHVTCETCKTARKAQLPKIRADFAKRKRLGNKLGQRPPWNIAGT